MPRCLKTLPNLGGVGEVIPINPWFRQKNAAIPTGGEWVWLRGEDRKTI